MDTRRDSPSRHLTTGIITSLGNPPTAALPELPPLIPVQPPQPSAISQSPPPSEVVETQTHRDLREEVTLLVTPWNPTPENILEVLRCSNIRLPCVDDLSGHDVQQPSSSSSYSTPQGQRQSLLQATSKAPAAVSGSLSSASQLPVSTEQNEAKSSFIKLVQPIPPQSRAFFKNIPFLHRLSYAGSADLDGSNSSSSSSSSPNVKATVDPFDSDRDVLSKVYILTTSAHSAVHLTSSSEQQQQQQQQKQKQKLPPKYMLKVFPDKTPFKHAATRTDPRISDQPSSSSSSSSASRAVMRTIVQSAMEHELGAIEWAQKFL